ncbi:MAG: hypothetical protein U5L07_15270 [Desulfobacterales bacterium]|nr:hypothetical protein [Desulfobacterales bacterium]
MNCDPAYDAKTPGGHLPFPDYTRPVLRVPEAARTRILEKLTRIYGESAGQAAYAEIERLMKVYYAQPDYKNFFIAFADKDAIPPDQLKKIVRPRTSILSAFAALDGQKAVWTTFSRDQIDLNYRFCCIPFLPAQRINSADGRRGLRASPIPPHSLISWIRTTASVFPAPGAS